MQRNRCAFDGAVPDMARALTLSSEERNLWSMAGAQGISFLTAPASGNLFPWFVAGVFG
jgi:hypothetical protein